MHRALPLAGWDEQSIWGYDPGTDSLFAQLWRNGDNQDEPRAWITPGYPGFDGSREPGDLAAPVAAAAGVTSRAVLLAMAAMAEPEAAAYLIECAGDAAPEDLAALADAALEHLRDMAPHAPDSRVRIRCLSLADGRTEGVPVGRYLADYDPEAEGGQGMAVWTADPAAAMAFDSPAQAMSCYQAQPKARPLRPDGKPNRPMTMFAIVLD